MLFWQTEETFNTISLCFIPQLHTTEKKSEEKPLLDLLLTVRQRLTTDRGRGTTAITAGFLFSSDYKVSKRFSVSVINRDLCLCFMQLHVLLDFRTRVHNNVSSYTSK